jgi:hypothetical protein
LGECDPELPGLPELPVGVAAPPVIVVVVVPGCPGWWVVTKLSQKLMVAPGLPPWAAIKALKAVELSRAGGMLVEVWLPGPARNAVHRPKVAFPLSIPLTGPTPELEDELALVPGMLVLEVLLPLEVDEADEVDEVLLEWLALRWEDAVLSPLTACDEACEVWAGRPPVMAAAVPAPRMAIAANTAALNESSLASIDALLGRGSTG